MHFLNNPRSLFLTDCIWHSFSAFQRITAAWTTVPSSAYLLLDPRLESAASPLFPSSSVLISDLFASILESPDSSERVVFGLLSKKLKLYQYCCDNLIFDFKSIIVLHQKLSELKKWHTKCVPRQWQSKQRSAEKQIYMMQYVTSSITWN